ncbi:MAG TPA: nuclear transport factor 2 family protein [Thermoleophilaceae bacterium]|jgi:ketosteroid isomerase-like protein
MASDAELAEDRFFEALAAADADRLEELLADDFLIVDVMSGGVADRLALVGALRDRVIVFDRVDVVERATRLYGETAVIVGRTEMAGSFQGEGFTTASRYTHVLVHGDDGGWRLASAQGTPIADG